jgi:ABC-type branched-subunit amino acid transport system ATPase component
MQLALTIWSEIIKKVIVKLKPKKRQLAIILSNQRQIGSITIQDPIFIMDEGHTAWCKLDTHTDTSVAGANFFCRV